MSVELLHTDCMTYMAGLPDKAFDLAIVDPPYGINASSMPMNNSRKGYTATKYDKKEWDKKPPDSSYWQQLKRISLNQIVFGGNYFTEHLATTKSWIVWDKVQPEGVSFSMHELIWTSLNMSGKIFRKSIASNNNRVANNKRAASYYARIHPTQKPIALYKWLLKNYARQGDRILDTHLGSGSSAIAAHEMKFDFVGCEIDKDYYDAACKRFKEQTAQLPLL